jgi:hypothetical protein
MKVVLLLGAGFSRPFGLPTMLEFFGQFRTDNRFGSEDQEFVETLQASANSGAGMLSAGRNNLEHVLSYALMSYLIAPDSNPSPAPLDRLRDILRRVYSRLKFDVVDSLRQHLSDLLQIRAGETPRHTLTVITTNYDLVAEFGFWSLGSPLKLPFSWRAADQGQHAGASLYAPSGEAPILCKLHGSLNWYQGPEGVEVVDRVVSVQGDPMKSRRDAYPLPYACAADFLAPPQRRAPLLIPPTLYKQQTDPYLDASWRAAYAALRQAERVVVIGYSFPESDTYMKYFIGSALASNTKIGQISIVDPRASSIVQSIKGKYGAHFEEMLVSVGGLWQENVTLDS